MIRSARHLPRAGLFLTLFGTLGVALPAHAGVSVSIQYDSEERLELAQRLSSELESEGYAVELQSAAEPSPCDSNAKELVAVGQGTKAWIRLKADPAGDGTVVATICYLGTLPLLQQATSRAPGSDPHQLALATAEALNGLRSRLPAVVGEVPHPVRTAEPPRVQERAADETPSSGKVNSIALSMALVVGAPDFPATPGADLRATLGLTRWASFAIDAFVPTSGAELTSAEMTATVRTAWFRVGPRFGGTLGDFQLSGAALAGPAITWATAEALPPRVGTADITTGAVLSLAGFVEYPATSTIFAAATTSASLLLPGVRVNLGDSEPKAANSWPLEASIGLGVRWDGR